MVLGQLYIPVPPVPPLPLLLHASTSPLVTCSERREPLALRRYYRFENNLITFHNSDTPVSPDRFFSKEQDLLSACLLHQSYKGFY